MRIYKEKGGPIVTGSAWGLQRVVTGVGTGLVTVERSLKVAYTCTIRPPQGDRDGHLREGVPGECARE